MAEPLFRGLARYELDECRSELLANLHAEWPEELHAGPSPGPAVIPGVMQPSAGALRFLMVTGSDWFRPITKTYTAARVHPAEGQELVQELRDSGLVTLHTVKTFRPGGQITIMLPTDAGVRQMRDAHIGFMPVRGDGPHGDGDATHIYYQNHVARWLREHDWTAEISMSLGAKQVDVGATRNRGQIRHAYEVVNEGWEKEVINLQKDLEDGWQKVVFCVGSPALGEQLECLLRSVCGPSITTSERVEFQSLPEFHASRNKRRGTLP